MGPFKIKVIACKRALATMKLCMKCDQVAIVESKEWAIIETVSLELILLIWFQHRYPDPKKQLGFFMKCFHGIVLARAPKSALIVCIVFPATKINAYGRKLPCLF